MRVSPKAHLRRLAALLTAALLLAQTLPLAAKKLTEEEAREKYGLHATVHDEWAVAAWEWTRDHVVAAYDWGKAQICGMLFEDMGVDTVDQVGLACPAFIALLMLLSGCWAASIAQMRRHNRLVFFLVGFFTFFIGPIVLLFKLDIKGEKELLARIASEAAEKRAQAAAKAALEEQQAIASGQQVVPKVSEEGDVWDKAYFERIAYRADGSPAGPWDAVYNNGIEAHVLQILEAQDSFVQVRYVNMAGKEMVGRIPLAKLESWKDA